MNVKGLGKRLKTEHFQKTPIKSNWLGKFCKFQIKLFILNKNDLSPTFIHGLTKHLFKIT